MDQIIIDGYNLIHRVPRLSQHLAESLEAAREALIQQLKTYLLNKKVKITLVFDGCSPPLGIDSQSYFRSLKVIFSRPPFKADPLIKNLIAKAPRKKSVLVVSDDAEIKQFAKAHQAHVISTLDFYDRLSKKSVQDEFYQKFDKELSQEELAKWLEIFGEK
ncbi:MAG: NYN domain-containing protein [bacterium]